jgi:hypothetical protein
MLSSKCVPNPQVEQAYLADIAPDLVLKITNHKYEPGFFRKGLPNIYVKIALDGQTRRTVVIPRTLNPEWKDLEPMQM